MSSAKRIATNRAVLLPERDWLLARNAPSPDRTVRG